MEPRSEVFALRKQGTAPIRIDPIIRGTHNVRRCERDGIGNRFARFPALAAQHHVLWIESPGFYVSSLEGLEKLPLVAFVG